MQSKDSNGKWDDITTGFDTAAEYGDSAKQQFFGCLVGRYANRIGGAKFKLNGKEYNLFKNNGGTAPNFLNSLHGGKRGFDKFNWDAKQISNGIELSMVSPDGDEGYPGTLNVTVQYVLMGNALSINYNATTSADTVINMTNHAYFNLDGHSAWGNLDNHSIVLKADHYTPVGDNAIPTGEVV